MLSQCELAVRLGHVITDPIKLHRGLPQGPPESPLLFISVCELVLRPLLLRWQTEGKGWFFCESWLASLGYADDILVFSENEDDVAKMSGELIDAFAKIGLDISAWSSYPPEKQGTLTVGGFGVEVGQIDDFCRHRHQLQAETTEKPSSTGLHRLRMVLGLGDNSYDHRGLH